MNTDDSAVVAQHQQWWLSNQGTPRGPYNESYILAGVKSGTIPIETLACPVGGQAWKHLYEWPPFSGAVPATLAGKKGNAGGYWALALGLFAMIAWVIPLFGFPVTIVGLVLGIRAWETQARIAGVIGAVLCGIALVATAINAMVGAYLGATGQL
jgi:hypothetical protein